MAYKNPSRIVAGRDEPLLEELSRRIVANSLKSLMDQTENSQDSHSRLADFINDIAGRQSTQSQVMPSFRMLLELNIYLSVFLTQLIEFFHLTQITNISIIYLIN